MVSMIGPEQGGASGPLVATVNRSTSGDGTAVVAGQVGKSIRVVSFVLNAASGVVGYFKPSAGTFPAAMFDPMSLTATGPAYLAGDAHFQDGVMPDLPPGADLLLNLSGSVAVTGVIVYKLVG